MDKNKLWLIEVLVWGLIVFTTCSIYSYIHNKNIDKYYTYHAFFKDIDGLIVGSPVKIQGVQVGHISELKFINDEILLTFIITDKNFKMPSKLDASVSFTGMGGSKSLELFIPPEGSNAKNYIRVVEPMRIKDFMHYSNQTSQILLTMMNDAMELMNDNTVKIIKEFIGNPKSLKDLEQTLDNVQKGEEDFLNKRRNNANKD